MGKSTVSMSWFSRTKVITPKSRGEVSLVEQDTIDYVCTAYFEPKKIFFQYKRCIMQGQLQEWTEHSTLIFENLKPVLGNATQKTKIIY